MEKESNYLSSVVLMSGALIASGAYLGVFRLAPKAAGFFLFATALLAVLGVVKISNRFACLLPESLRQIVHWIHSMVFEALAVLTTFCIRPLGWMSRHRATGCPEKGRPILLIHGYLHDASAWIYLKRSLCKKGFGPVYTLNLVHPFRSIGSYAKRVAERAAEIAKETGRQDLALIGHSMGGLVASWYAARCAPQGKVSDVITIGSPLAGTRVASIALGPNGREMRRGSGFSQALREEIGKSDSVRFYHIASRTDQLIVPYSSALMGFHPEREYLIDDIGHMTLLFSPRVGERISEWLGSVPQDEEKKITGC